MTSRFVIFGVTGNLMYKKLVPALVHLDQIGQLPTGMDIFCVGRREYTNEEYHQVLLDETGIDPRALNDLFHRLTYVKVNFEDPHSYQALVDSIPMQFSVFYLAVPPRMFPIIGKGLFDAGLVERGNLSHRVVFEKPFGSDLASAREINQELKTYLVEDQIYRIDHYLGKDMIQNVLIVRFANGLFDHVWTNEFIESVTILAKEEESVMQRGNYYDHIGALKDMVQSHLMQLAALTAMDEPTNYDANSIRQAKIAVMKNLSIDPADVILGQYNGYLKEVNIEPGSTTETAVFLRAYVNSDRFRGVPFYFLTGKMMEEKRSEIRIRFKESAKAKQLFSTFPIKKNEIIIRVAPEEGLSVNFNLKNPGLEATIDQHILDYSHHAVASGNIPEAYQKLFLDAFQGNPTLFTTWDEVESSWSIIHHLREHRPTPIIYSSYAAFKEAVIRTFPEVSDEI